MANDILGFPYSTPAANLYALIRNRAGEVLTVAGLTFGAYVTANLGDYDIALTEQGTASRFYSLTFPALPAGEYFVAVYLRAGGSPAEGDVAVAEGIVLWTGAAIVDEAERLENIDVDVSSRLAPTVAGRTLDISAAGEAGIDWANVGSPTTTVGLSGTTIKTATDVEADTQDIQARLPAALTAGGNIKSDALALSGDTVAADNAESFFDGTGYAGTNNVMPTVTTVTNRVTANVDQLGGVAQSLTDLMDFADAGYDPVTNKVQGVVLVDTLTTYTGNTPQTGDSFARIGATGSALTSLASQASVNTIDDFLDTEIAAVLADTGELQTDWANGGRLDLILDARASQAGVDNLPTLAEILAGGDIDGFTLEQTLKICLAALAGKLSGAETTTIVIRAADDSKTRITATVTSDENRTAVTLDAAG